MLSRHQKCINLQQICQTVIQTDGPASVPHVPTASESHTLVSTTVLFGKIISIHNLCPIHVHKQINPAYPIQRSCHAFFA